MKWPNYDKCLVNLSSSILAHYGADVTHHTLSEADELLKNHHGKVILFLFDGLATKMMETHLKKDGFFRSHILTDLSSVFPPTTVAATTALIASLEPCETAWLGWSMYFEDLDKTINVFPKTEAFTDLKIDVKVMEGRCDYESISEKISKTGYKAQSYLELNYDVSVSQFLNNSSDLLKTNDFVYAYFTNPDGTLHSFGNESLEASKCIEEIEREVSKFVTANPNVLVFLVADHGHIVVRYFDIHEHQDFYECLISNYSLESRAASFRVVKGKEKQFEEAYKKYYAQDFMMLSRQEVINKGLFGKSEKRHPLFEKFIGDYLLVSINDAAFCFDISGDNLYSLHAGLTEDELELSLLAFNN